MVQVQMPSTSISFKAPTSALYPFPMNIRLQVIDAIKEEGIDLSGFDEFVDLDHPAAFRSGLFEFLRIDDDIFPILHFKPFGPVLQRAPVAFSYAQIICWCNFT